MNTIEIKKLAIGSYQYSIDGNTYYFKYRSKAAARKAAIARVLRTAMK